MRPMSEVFYDTEFWDKVSIDVSKGNLRDAIQIEGEDSVDVVKFFEDFVMYLAKSYRKMGRAFEFEYPNQRKLAILAVWQVMTMEEAVAFAGAIAIYSGNEEFIDDTQYLLEYLGSHYKISDAGLVRFILIMNGVHYTKEQVNEPSKAEG